MQSLFDLCLMSSITLPIITPRKNLPISNQFRIKAALGPVHIWWLLTNVIRMRKVVPNVWFDFYKNYWLAIWVITDHTPPPHTPPTSLIRLARRSVVGHNVTVLKCLHSMRGILGVHWPNLSDWYVFITFSKILHRNWRLCLKTLLKLTDGLFSTSRTCLKFVLIWTYR